MPAVGVVGVVSVAVELEVRGRIVEVVSVEVVTEVAAPEVKGKIVEASPVAAVSAVTGWKDRRRQVRKG